MSSSRITVRVISTIIILSFFIGFTAVTAGETPPITIRGVLDHVEDLGDDGTLDYLTITVQVNVRHDDTYTIYGSLEPLRSKPITAHNASSLSEGDGTLSLKFPGARIFDSQMDGPYTVILSITDDEEYISDSYSTADYSYEDFNPTKEISLPRVMDSDNLTLEFEFESIMRKPTITFYHPNLEEEYRFAVAFDEIVGFADDGNGVWDEKDEVVVRGDLTQRIWDWSFFYEGSSFRFRFENTILLWGTKELEPVASVDIKFIFNTDFLETNYKFDIDMEFSEPVEGVDFFTLVQTLEDLAGNTEFNVMEDQGRVQFINGDNEEMAYYEWIKEADSFSGDSKEKITLAHTYDIDGSVMTLQLNYPYSTAVDRIFHDPKLGIKAISVNDPSEDEEDQKHSMILFGCSLVVGGLFIAYTIHAQRKRG